MSEIISFCDENNVKQSFPSDIKFEVVWGTLEETSRELLTLKEIYQKYKDLDFIYLMGSNHTPIKINKLTIEF